MTISVLDEGREGLFPLAVARRHQIQEAHKIRKIDFMTPKMAIKTILLTTKASKPWKKSSLVCSIRVRDMQRCYTGYTVNG